jgi:hypothetical protein
MKRFITIFAAVFFVIALGFSLSGCGDSDDNDLPVETLRFTAPQDGIGEYQFYTNDEQFYGYSYSRSIQNPKTDQDDYEIIANKKSGSRNTGYGMIFCVNNIPNLDSNEFYRVLITVEGHYQISKRFVDDEGTGFDYKTFFPETGNNWPESLNLTSGYNRNNTLRVKKTGNTFTVYFNGQEELQFTDNEPLEGDGVMGFFVGISSEEDENFPNEPVDVRFSRVMDE